MKQTKRERFKLDISSPNDKLVDHCKQELYNAAQSCYAAKKRVKISRVCEDNVLICQCKRPFLLAVLFHKDGRPYLLWICMRKGTSKYFVKAGDKWMRISSEDYSNKRLHLMIKANPDKHISIDVNTPKNTEFWTINQIDCGDRKHVLFFPEVGYYARVVVGDKTIWKAENDTERCIVAEAFYNQNQKELVMVWISDLKKTNINIINASTAIGKKLTKTRFQKFNALTTLYQSYTKHSVDRK